MNFIPYLLGIVGSALTTIFIVLFNQWTGFEIHSLSIFFIIPVGGFLLGAGGSGGFFLGRKLTNTKTLKRDFIVAIILGFLTFFCVNFVSYVNTYISIDSKDEIEILYQFTQPEEYVSISQLMSFKDYMNMINSSSTHQFRYRAAKVGDGIEAGKMATTFLFYVQLLGVLIGSLAMTLGLATEEYCDRCKKYYKNKILKNFDIENIDEDFDNINKNIKNGISLKKVIQEIKNTEGKVKKYGQMELSYCPVCHDGYLLIKFYILDSSGDFNEISNSQQILKLNQGVVMELARE